MSVVQVNLCNEERQNACVQGEGSFNLISDIFTHILIIFMFYVTLRLYNLFRGFLRLSLSQPLPQPPQPQPQCFFPQLPVNKRESKPKN